MRRTVPGSPASIWWDVPQNRFSHTAALYAKLSLARGCLMDFMPYARPYLDRIFGAEGEPVAARLNSYAVGWGPAITEQFLVHDFARLPAPSAPAMVDGFARAHLRTLALSRMPGGLLVAAVHCPSLLRRDIAFEIGIVIKDGDFASARLKANVAHRSELSLFLLGMGTLATMQQAMKSLPG